MNFLKEHGTKALGVIGSLLGILAMNLTPEQIVSILGAKGPGAIMLASGILTYLRGHQNSGTLPGGPTQPPTIKAYWLVTLLLALMCTVSLTGCKTTPTANERVGINAAVAAAVAITVQRGTSDPAVWATRAGLIVSVANAVKPLATDDAVSLPAIASAVGPLLDKAQLAPGERIAANQLVIALSQVIEANTDAASPVAVSIADVLNAAIENARVYVPLTATPSAVF